MVNPVVPKDEEAEIAILGSVMLDGNLMSLVVDEISSEDFYNERNRTIFRAMESLYKNGNAIDFTTLMSELDKVSALESAGGVPYLTEVSSYSYNTANIENYVDLVRGTALKRKTIDALGKLVQSGYDGKLLANDYVTEAEKVIFELSKNKRTTEFETISQAVDTVKANVERNASADGSITGLDTGFDNLNKATLGLQKSKLIILAARPAMGKSALAMNIAVNVAAKNKGANVAVFNLEMSSDELTERMVAAEALVNLRDIKTGKMDARQNIAFLNATEKLKKLNMYFDCNSGNTIEDIRTKCRKLAATKGLDLVVVDYLQLIAIDKGSAGKQRNEQVAEVSRALKRMARELDVPVIALAQLSRDVEKREDKRPMMSDLRDSGSIEQDADIIMFLHRDEYYSKRSDDEHTDMSPRTELIIAKNRAGQRPTLNFNFKGQYVKFEETIGDENNA